jgi:CSLREA domain-containing protein
MSRSTVRGVRRRTALSLVLLLAPAVAALAATITVDTTADADVADADCSLREAIVAANTDAAYNGCAAGSGLDTVQFDLTTPATITLTADLPEITADLGILGLGVDELTIDGAGAYAGPYVDSPSGGADLYVRDLTMTNGYELIDPIELRAGGFGIAPGDRGIFVRVRFVGNSSSNFGGALTLNSLGPANPATGIVDQCLFEGNASEGAAGGGALYATNGTILTISRSTFVGNEALGSSGSGGGAMELKSATTTIRRTTITGNSANGGGGGISISTTEIGPSSLTITDSTITGNAAGLVSASSNGGGISISPYIVTPVQTTVVLRNTIVAENSDGGPLVYPDVAASTSTNLTFTSNGFNLIGSNANSFTLLLDGTPNGNGDFVGTSAAPLLHLLGALADNGAPTPTRLPIEDAGSLVVDHGDCFQNAGDQRGYVDSTTGIRPVDNATVPNHANSDGCDIGAAELGAVPSDFVFADDFESATTFAWSATVP